MAPTPDGIRVTPENVEKELQRDELKNYTKEELMILAEAKDETSDSKESKETFVKSLEFEPDTFKIDSTGWKEVTDADKDDPIFGKFVEQEQKVKVNATGDVVEYLEDKIIDGETMCKKGEQIFIFDYNVKSERDRFFGYIAAAKGCPIEEVESRYFMTEDEFIEKMKDKPNYSEEYKKFFNKDVKGHLAGYWDPDSKEFYDIGDRSNILLADGVYYAEFNRDRWSRDNFYDSYGFSVRLLKN